MRECIHCHELTVDPEEPPRYDVLSEDWTGPYCADCWTTTHTYVETHTETEETPEDV